MVNSATGVTTGPGEADGSTVAGGGVGEGFLKLRLSVKQRRLGYWLDQHPFHHIQSGKATKVSPSAALTTY